MIMPQQFVFRGDAVGAAASVRRRKNQVVNETLPAQAVSSLPVIGGHSEQQVDGSSSPDPFLSFKTAKSSSDGSYDSARNAYVTKVVSTLTGISVAEKFTAESVTAQLVSVHPGSKQQQPSISWSGTALVNLAIEGYPINVVLDTVLEPLNSEERLVEAYKDSSFQQKYRERFFRAQELADEPIPRVGRNGYIAYSIVESVTTTHPNAKVQGHVLTVQDFGRIHFGEILVSPDSRRLTLLRFELGSPYAGSISLAGVGSNGETLP